MTTINRRPVAGGSGGVETDPVFGTSEAASLAVGDAAKLAGIEAGAQVNVPETDPIVGAITGIPKADGAGNISAAVAGTDYANPIFNPATLDDGEYQITEGEVATYGETVAKFDVCYRASNGKLYLVDSTDTAKTPDVGGFLILTAGDADEQHTVMTRGYFRNDALAAGFSAHETFYADPATPGGLTVTQPTIPGYQMKIMGQVTGTAKICKFAPEIKVQVGRYTTAAVDDYDLTTPIALANSLKTVMNAHAADGVEHAAADDVNFPVATADADDITTLIALTAALLTAYDGHDADAEAGSPTYHDATEAGDHSLASAVAPTTAGECVTRLLDLKAKYNAHDADATAHDTGSQHQETTADCVLAITPNLDYYTAFELTAIDEDLTVNEPVGTPVNGASFIAIFTDDGTPRNITWDAAYNESATIELPAATVTSETAYHQFTYKLSTTLFNYTGAPGGY